MLESSASGQGERRCTPSSRSSTTRVIPTQTGDEQLSEAVSRGTEFPHGATVRELAAVLAAIPEEERDREVVVQFTPAGVTRAEGLDLPGVIWAFDPFPERTTDPQPAVVCWTIRAMDGLSTAAEIETFRTFQEFLDDGSSDPEPV